MVMRFGEWLEAFSVEKLMDTPERAIEYAKQVGQRVPELEPLILQDKDITARYLLSGLPGRWKPGEEAIKDDPWWVLKYARDVIGGRWPEGEAVFKGAPIPAYKYAVNVAMERVPELEPTIALFDVGARKYFDKILKPWLRAHSGEPVPKEFRRWRWL